MRAFDATLNLETSAVAIASLKVTYADMQASLKNGVFTLAKLTGQFYGGAVDFNGTIDATKDALTLDLRGSLQGIYLGEMLRGMGGTNSFGNQNLMVSIDGKINVMNIALKGSGTSPEQIRNSLNGSGQVSGYLYPAVTGGSLGFASFATGVGSLFSTEMGLASATLAGFINRQSPVTGQLVLQGDTVTLQNHTLQGQNAVATDHQPEQHDDGHDRHDDLARHRQARPGRLCDDGEGADLLADPEHARRQQLTLISLPRHTGEGGRRKAAQTASKTR